jgi:hypothetical protein
MRYQQLLKLLKRLAGLFLLPAFFVSVAAQETLELAPFSAQSIQPGLPAGWQPLIFNGISRHSVYELVDDDGVTVVRATSENAASGLLHPVSVDLKRYPLVQWRWKITCLIDKGDATSREGDDYPARLYIAFDFDIDRLTWLEHFKYDIYLAIYGEYPPLAVLNYIWDRRLPVDTLLPNAYTDHVQMIVVQSGSAHLGEWVVQQRNVYRDYLRAFGEPPPMVSGVAIMTDTDNTGESALSYYGDIRFVQDSSDTNQVSGEQ